MDPYLVIRNRQCVVDSATRVNSAPLILKYTTHIACGCVLVQADAVGKVVIEAKKKRVNVVQLFWLTVIGMRGHYIDHHVHRKCTTVHGFVCMNPDHIIYTKTGETMTRVIPKLSGGVHIHRAGGFGGRRADVQQQYTDKRLSPATTVIVFDEASLPTSMSDMSSRPRVLDYMLLLPGGDDHG